MGSETDAGFSSDLPQAKPKHEKNRAASNTAAYFFICLYIDIFPSTIFKASPPTGMPLFYDFILS